MLCPRCDVGLWGLKRKQRKLKEPLLAGRKRGGRLESLSDLERALAESKETAAAVRTPPAPALTPAPTGVLGRQAGAPQGRSALPERLRKRGNATVLDGRRADGTAAWGSGRRSRVPAPERDPRLSSFVDAKMKPSLG